jgi:hypothetical protein
VRHRTSAAVRQRSGAACFLYGACCLLGHDPSSNAYAESGKKIPHRR